MPRILVTSNLENTSFRRTGWFVGPKTLDPFKIAHKCRILQIGHVHAIRDVIRMVSRQSHTATFATFLYLASSVMSAITFA